MWVIIALAVCVIVGFAYAIAHEVERMVEDSNA